MKITGKTDMTTKRHTISSLAGLFICLGLYAQEID